VPFPPIGLRSFSWSLLSMEYSMAPLFWRSAHLITPLFPRISRANPHLFLELFFSGLAAVQVSGPESSELYFKSAVPCLSISTSDDRSR